MIRSDHPSSNKRGGVAIYYYLSESILFQLRSPSQTADNLKLNLDAMTDNNPFLVVAIGDLNARSSSWCINDKSNYEGTKIDCLAIEYNFKHVINEPIHFFKNSSSCIDLILFT